MLAHHLEARINYRVDNKAARVGLVGDIQHFPFFAEAFDGGVHLGFNPKRNGETLDAFDHRVGTGVAARRKQRGPQPGTPGITRGKPARHGGMRLAQTRRLIGSYADGGGHLVFIQVHDLARCHSRADAAHQPRHRQADRYFGRGCHHNIADTALNFITQYQRMYELPAAEFLPRSHGYQRCTHRAGRVRNRGVMGVVEGQRSRT